MTRPSTDLDLAATEPPCSRRSAPASWRWCAGSERLWLLSPRADDVKASPVDGSISIDERFSLSLTYGPPELPPDLAAIVDAWPDLPEAIKAGIVAIVLEAMV